MIFKMKIRKRGNELISKLAKNPYYIQKEKRKSVPLWVKIVIPCGSIATVGLILGLLIPLSLHKNDNSRYEKIYVDYLPWEQESEEIIKQWDEKATTEKYPNFTINGIDYHIAGNGFGTPVSSAYAGEKVGNVIGKGFDEITEENKEIDGEVFKITNIEADAALLARFNGDSNYYAYFNSDTSFDTVQAIYDKISPKETLTFTYTYYFLIDENGDTHYIRFDDFDDRFIYETLLDDCELVDEMKGENSAQTYSIFKQPFMFTSYQSEIFLFIIIFHIKIA